MSKYLFLFVLVPLFTSVKIKSDKLSISSTNSSIRNDSLRCDSLVEFAKKYLHKPYCYGSKVPKCFDCSGFVNFVFKEFGKTLPNSSGIIAYEGKFISFRNAIKGDLVFFNGRNYNNETIGHVGIVTECKDGLIYFIHASVQAGIIISNTGETYYKNRLLFVKRVAI
jgi:cell wall-associated NlpC family hydrolase